jgi:hypothetical protein
MLRQAFEKRMFDMCNSMIAARKPKIVFIVLQRKL